MRLTVRRSPLAYWPFALALGLAAVCAVDCSPYVFDATEQCSNTGDCVKRGAPFADTRCEDGLCVVNAQAASGSAGAGGAGGDVDTPWGCLGSVRYPRLPVEQIEFIANTFDAISVGALSGVAIQVCARRDAECARPLSDTALTTDASGLSPLINLPNENTTTTAIGLPPFSGYIQLTKSGYFPTILFPLVTRSSRAPHSAPMMPESDFAQIGALISVNVEAGRGHLFVIAQDCLGRLASGVQVRVLQADEKTSVPLYLAGGFPSTSAQATDVSGVAVIANVPPGFANVVLAREGKDYSQASYLVRPDHMTVVTAGPTP
jgi:hypothetical protein